MKNGTRKKTNAPVNHGEQPGSTRQIKIRAYEIWQADGCCEGKELEHWLQAERELAEFHSYRQGHQSASTFA